MPQSGTRQNDARNSRRVRRPRKILIHINNTNPILDEDSPERARLTAADIEVGVLTACRLMV